jgi:hypothetical protein
MERGLGCLDEKLVPMLIGRTYRSIGSGYMVGGDVAKGTRWFRTAVEVDPAFQFGLEEFAVDHPVRLAYDEVRLAPSGTPAAVEGSALAAGDFYLDGRGLTDAAATRGRPHLLQLVGERVDSWLIDGNSFPSAVLVVGGGDADTAKAKEPKESKPPKVAKAPKAPKEPKAAKAPKEPMVAEVEEPTAEEPKVAKAPKEPKPPKEKPADDAVADGPPPPPATGSGGTVMVRKRPPEKTPLIIAGGVIVVGAGAMYAAAIASRQKFDKIDDSEDDLRKAQNATNRLYLGSIGVLAAGAGTMTWGIILDGSGNPMGAIRGRF